MSNYEKLDIKELQKKWDMLRKKKKEKKRI
jgi:hypothetical protein